MESQLLLTTQKVGYPNINYFYPIGNTPAQFLTQNCPADLPVHRGLLLGCGDIRSILFTSWCQRRNDCDLKAKTRLDFTCCDYEAAILARNIMVIMRLLKMGPGDTVEALERLWSLYHDQFLSKDYLSVLHETADALLSCGDTVDQWHKTQIGQNVKMASQESLRRLRAIWKKYSDRSLPQKLAKNKLSKQRSDFNKLRIGNAIKLNNVLRCTPLTIRAIANMDAHMKANQLYRETGLTREPEEQTLPNPMFVVTEKRETEWCVHYGTEPLDSYLLSTAYADIILDKDSRGIALPQIAARSKKEDQLLTTCMSQFATWCIAFQELLNEKRIVMRMFVGDALEFCDALSFCNNSTKVPRMFLPQWSLAPLCLDGRDYAMTESGSRIAPTLFDVIDTSNLSDWLGMFGLVLHAAPLLMPDPHSVLHTDTLAPGLIDTQADLIRLISFMTDDPTASVLLGLSVSAHLTGFTSRNTAEEHLFSSVSSSKDPKKQQQRRLSVSWKLSWTCDDSAVRALASTDGRVMRPSLLANDSELTAAVVAVNSLAECPHPLNARQGDLIRFMFREYQTGHYAPETIVRFAMHCCGNIRSIDEDSDRCGMMRMRIFETSQSILRTNVLQEQFLLWHLHGLYMHEAFQESPLNEARDFRGGTLPEDCFVSSDSPPIVRIGILVPQSALARLEVNPLKFPVPNLILDIVGSSFLNQFHSVHMAFVRKIDSSTAENQGPDDEPITHWDNFTLQQCSRSHSDAYLAVSAMIPSCSLAITSRSETRIAVAVDPGFQNCTETSKRFGKDNLVFSAPLSKVSLVSLITSGAHAFPTKTFGAHKYAAGVKNSTAVVLELDSPSIEGISGTSISVRFNENGSVVGFQTRLTLSYTPKRALAVGGTVSVHQHSQCIIRVSIEGDGKNSPGTTTCGVLFPYPVDVHTAMLKVSRKQGWIDITVSPWNAGYSFKPFSLIRTPVSGYLVPWGLDRVVLPSCPVLSERKCKDWMYPLSGMIFSINERAIVTTAGGIGRGHSMTELKESLHAMLETFCGNQVAPDSITPWFCIHVKNDGGVLIVIHVNALRLDLANASAVLDVSICPLTQENVMIVGPHIHGFTKRALNATREEFEAWMHLVPVAVERARRGWVHKPECEYRKPNAQIPLTTEVGGMPCCRCGIGKDLPESFTQKHGSIGRFFFRAALSPLFPAKPQGEAVRFDQPNSPLIIKSTKATDQIQEVSNPLCPIPEAPRPSDSLPSVITVLCSKCRTAGATLLCSRCRKARYCGKNCQRTHWPSHKLSCNGQ